MASVKEQQCEESRESESTNQGDQLSQDHRNIISLEFVDPDDDSDSQTSEDEDDSKAYEKLRALALERENYVHVEYSSSDDSTDDSNIPTYYIDTLIHDNKADDPAAPDGDNESSNNNNL